MNAVNKVAVFLEPISLNKAPWAKFCFRDRRRSFGPIDLKIEMHIICRYGLTAKFFRDNISHRFFLTGGRKKSFFKFSKASKLVEI